MQANGRTKLSPPQLAKQWGIGVDKILVWIRRCGLTSSRAGGESGRVYTAPRFVPGLTVSINRSARS